MSLPKYPFQEPLQPGSLESFNLLGQKEGQVFELVLIAILSWFSLK